MKANEIRIGNLFSHTNDNGTFNLQVEEIRPTGIITTWNGGSWFVLFDKIVAIPLTEEILLKAGFEKESEDDKYGRVFLIPNTKYIIRVVNYGNPQKVDFGYSLEISDNKDWCGIKRIYFLHDLQNTIFALTGEDIKIEV